MPEPLDLGFCSLEFREGFMIATIKPNSPITDAETLRVAAAKREHYGNAKLGLVIYNPANSTIDAGIFLRAESIMKEQGYSFLIIARPNISGSRMLELFNKHCLIYVGDSLEDAIAHAEEVLKSSACV